MGKHSEGSRGIWKEQTFLNLEMDPIYSTLFPSAPLGNTLTMKHPPL